jgi:hypothetical protein
VRTENSGAGRKASRQICRRDFRLRKWLRN